MASFTTDDLLTRVKQLASPPGGQVTFSDAEILNLATESLQTWLAPTIKDVKEGYFQYPLVYIVNTTGNYVIPTRSIGNTVDYVQVINQAGEYFIVAPTPPAAPDAQPLNPAAYSNAIYCTYSIQGNNVVINPAQISYASVVLNYSIRPSDLVAVTAARQIQSVTPTTITLVSTIVPGLATGTAFDIIDQNSPYAFKGIDQTGTVAGNVITMAAVPTGVAAGDWVALAEQSPIAQIPKDFMTVLAYDTAKMLLESIGQPQSAATMEKNAEKLMDRTIKTITPRMSNQPRKMRSFNPFIGNGRWSNNGNRNGFF